MPVFIPASVWATAIPPYVPPAPPAFDLGTSTSHGNHSAHSAHTDASTSYTDLDHRAQYKGGLGDYSSSLDYSYYYD